MKKINFRPFGLFAMAAMVVFSALFTACEKEGPAGPAGQNGTDGTDGKDGSDGNANVKSAILTIYASDWKRYDGYSYVDFTNVPIITQEVADGGAVMAYLKQGTVNSPNTEWVPMPYAFVGNGTIFSDPERTVSFRYRANFLQVRSIEDSSDFYEPDLTIKLVAMTANGRLAPVDWNDYEAVAEYFNIAE